MSATGYTIVGVMAVVMLIGVALMARIVLALARSVGES